jgi:hypothetical protein
MLKKDVKQIILPLLILSLIIGCSQQGDSIVDSNTPKESEEILNDSNRENMISDDLSLQKKRSYPWLNHAYPFDFLFENHIDTHQQTKLLKNRRLLGFFYIKYTGNITPEGYPEAKHGNCNETPDECKVGWVLHGIPVRATLVEKQEGQHPTWCVDPRLVPREKGFTHFHWLGQPEHAGDLTVGKEYDGYLLKLVAKERFFFDHHGGFFVNPGIDYETHANIVTDCDF